MKRRRQINFQLIMKFKQTPRFSLRCGSFVALALFFSSFSSGASEVDVGKFCLDKFCLGDSAAKHGGLASFKGFAFYMPPNKRVTKLGDAPTPSCGKNDIPAIHSSQSADATKYITVTLSPSPEHLSGGKDEYYRISNITASFPKAGKEDVDKLMKSVFDRTGVRYEKSFVVLSEGYLWRSKATVNGSAHGPAKESILIYSSMGSSVTLEHRQFPDLATQPGCLAKPPAL